MTGQSPTPIAVVGIGCRLPGAHGPEEFWRQLRDGYDGVDQISADRIALGAFDESTVAELAGCKGGFVDDIDKFEPAFFGISPREAIRMDPQLRLLLETVWETLEDAGQPPDSITGSTTGVFVGHATADYRDMQESDRLTDSYAALASIRALVSGFLSHAFDLRGPSMSVDTACSSSLVAVHMACQSLRGGESDLALAGGVNLILAPENFLGLSRYGLFATDGKCKFGDAGADGFVRSDGVALVALKTLDRALADSDRVYAVILGSAMNNDGRGGGYLGRPSTLGQAEVLRAAFENAGVAAADVDYIEAHGTGTPVGDVVELEALGAVLGHGRHADRPCLVGSVKTNIGHTESAAGVAGLIKTALCLHHGQLPPSLHLNDPNPGVDWAGLPVVVPSELTPLPQRDRPWLAGVNSFGISGTNAHVVMSQFNVSDAPDEHAGEARLLVLSSHSPQALRELARSYVGYLAADGREVALRDICYSAARRQHQTCRLAVVGSTHDEIVARLNDFLAGKPRREVVARDEIPERTPRIAFVFPGQGAQWVGMGRELLSSSPVFRTALERCDEAVRQEAGWSVLAKLTNGEPLGGVEFVQPTLWAIQVAIAELWRSWGVEPDLVIGHSMGEIAAATVAGALDLKDAATVICRRSLLAAKNTGRGVMASVSLSAEQTAEAIADNADRVSIAVINSPCSTVISGDPDAVTDVLSMLAGRDVFCRRLDVPFAAHSPQVDDLRDELRRALAVVGARPGKVTIHSTVVDEIIDGSALDAEYWIRNFREPVQFSSTVRTVLRRGPAIFLEISPHPVLVPAIEECVESYGLDGAAIPSLWREQPEKFAMLSSLGALYTSGYPISLRQLYGDEARLVSLPTYRWQRERHWITPRRAEPRTRHPLLGQPVPVAGPERIWEARLDLARNPYLEDHRVEGLIAFPGTGLCELTVAAARAIAGDRPIVLEDVEITRVLLLRDQAPTLRVRLVPERDSVWHAEVSSRADDDVSWTVHGTARVRVGDHQPSPGEPLPAIQERCQEHLSGREAYQRMTTGGNQWQGQFQGIAEVWLADGEALARIVCPSSLTAGLADFDFHPALLDACGQAMVAAAGDLMTPLVLGGIREVRLHGRPGQELWSHARLESAPGGDALTGDVLAFDADGRCVLELRGMRLQDPNKPADVGDWLYELRWEPNPYAERAESSAGRAEPAEPGTWIILGDAGGVGRDLRERLESTGQHCVTVGYPGSREVGDHVLDPADPTGFQHSLTSVLIDQAAAASPVRGVVHLWSLDAAALDAASADDVTRAELLGCQSVVRLVQSLAAVPPPAQPRLWLVTRGTQAVRSLDTSLSPLAATLWGLGRVLMTEHPELRPILVDLEEGGPPDALYRELTTAGDEDQVVLRGNDRYVARLDRYQRPVKETAPSMPSRLGATEVEIAIAYADLCETPDTECVENISGTISGIGSSVPGLDIGDEVIAIGPVGEGPLTVADASLVFRRPASLSLADAATIPVAYLTAYYALGRLGDLRKGDRVLIHDAAGPVGLAAIQIARWKQAEIFATAASPRQRALLRAMEIRHVADSRSAGFVAEFLAATQGEGVDLVLNSLAGHDIQANLGLLAPYGRYIGLTGGDDRIAVPRTISLHVMNVADMLRGHPVRASALLREVLDHVAGGQFPPLPSRTFPVRHKVDAVQHLARREHLGTVLLSYRAGDDTGGRARAAGPPVRPDAAYLVTGGLGGIGLKIAEWLIAGGATHLILTGRSPVGEGTDALDVLRRSGSGVRVHYHAADVADETAMRAVLRDIDQRGWPAVRGVFHTAGTVEFGLAAELDAAGISAVLRPKVQGSLVLHRLFEGKQLDSFVLFSSLACLLSFPMVGGYAAANSFLDALAHHRRQRGEVATSVNWSVWDSVGMDERAQRESLPSLPEGMSGFHARDNLEILARLLRDDATQVAVFMADWVALARAHPQAAGAPLMRRLVPPVVARTTRSPTRRLLGAGDDPHEEITRYLVEQLAAMLEMPPEQINMRRPLIHSGINSLLALELRNRVSNEFGVALPVVQLLGGYTLAELVDTVVQSTS